MENTVGAQACSPHESLSRMLKGFHYCGRVLQREGYCQSSAFIQVHAYGWRATGFSDLLLKVADETVMVIHWQSEKFLDKVNKYDSNLN